MPRWLIYVQSDAVQHHATHQLPRAQVSVEWHPCLTASSLRSGKTCATIAFGLYNILATEFILII